MVADSARDADVIASGREPRERTRRAPGLAWLLAGVLAAALAVAVAVAVHYRAEAARARPGVPPAASRTAALSLPQVTSTALRLRIAVLRIKDHWHRQPAYPHRVGGLDIYTAVVDDGVRTLDEFSAWLAARGLLGAAG